MGFVRKDTWIGLFMLAVAAIYWNEATKIRISPLDGPIGASGLPKTLAYTLGALAIVLIARDLLGVYLARRSAIAATDPEPRKGSLRAHMRAAGMLALGIGYLLVVPYLGYVISIGLLVGAVSLYIGAPLSLRTLLVAVIGAGFFYLLFVQFLGIPLTPGMLYDLLRPGP